MDKIQKKNICFIWQGFYPWDVRLEKFISTLGKSYGLYLISKGKKNTPLIEKNTTIEIQRVFFKGFAGKLLNAPVFFNPFWIIKAAFYTRNKNIDLIIVRDLPLIWLGFVLKTYLRIPLVFDMAENYPAALVAYKKWYYKPFLFCNAFLPRVYERIAARVSNHIIVVTQEQKKRLVSQGIQAGKISIVSNTPILEELEPYENQANDENGTIILYTGKIDAHRGVETAIRAMPEIIEKFPSVKLVLAGEGTEVNKLKILAEKLGIISHVEFLGWVSHSDIYKNIHKSTICLIPHLKSEHTDTTVPNKLFDYMALGKPVISSDLVPIMRIIDECQCGMIFKSGDHHDLSAKAIDLLQNQNAGYSGQNGINAVAKEFNWMIDSVNLKKVVDALT